MSTLKGTTKPIRRMLMAADKKMISQFVLMKWIQYSTNYAFGTLRGGAAGEDESEVLGWDMTSQSLIARLPMQNSHVWRMLTEMLTLLD